MDDVERLRELVALTFDLPVEAIAPETTQDTCAQWDSLAHLNLMLAVEDAFGLTLSVEEMAAMTSVAAILERVRG
jgi:acyl carrier protein